MSFVAYVRNFCQHSGYGAAALCSCRVDRKLRTGRQSIIFSLKKESTDGTNIIITIRIRNYAGPDYELCQS